MQDIVVRLATLALLSSACSTATMDSRPASPSVADGSDLKETVQNQIASGAKLFGKNCASCHGGSGEGGRAPKLVGEGALPRQAPAGRVHRKGEFASVQDIFDFVRATMPPEDPGMLSDDEVWSILAFDLNANGIELSAPLAPSNASDLPVD